MSDNTYLHNIALNPQKASSFTSESQLWKQIKRDKRQISKGKLKKFLSGQRAYTLHKPRRIHFPRSKIRTYDIDDLWESDLMELPRLTNANDGNRYVLVIIDTLSKCVWVKPLRRKSADAVTEAFESVIDTTGRSPKLLRTDNDRAYLSRQFQQMVQSHAIHFYTTRDDATKAAIVERVIRTIKARIAKYLTAFNTERYIDQLQNLVDGYNSTVHRTIGMRPVNVMSSDVPHLLRNFFKKPTVIKPRKFKSGDMVRFTKKSNVFDKEGAQKWKQEVMFIDRLKGGHQPYRYTLKEWDGDQVLGSFYEHELQKVKQVKFLIEKVLAHKTDKRGRKLVKVRWLGYDPKYDSWITRKAMDDIRTNV